MRIGLGFDVHRFAEGRRLVLGGLEIPHEQGLEGHSDADVVLHAVADSILGAAGRGDIGQHFPPDNPVWKDADSSDLLNRVMKLIARDWQVNNLDITIIAESPRIGPHRAEMRDRVAAIVGVESKLVNVKATTSERMGFIGRGEGIASLATVLLVARSTKEGQVSE